MPTLKEITDVIEAIAPKAWQQSWDNTGWQVCPTAPQDTECRGALLTLDITESVISEAIDAGANLVISHHPLLFKGLRQITDSTPSERIVAEAIRHGIAIYSAHTNIDSAPGGVNFRLAELLGLTDIEVLSPRDNDLVKLTFYTPLAGAEDVRRAVFEAGAGSVGNYDSCSYNTDGTGSFRAVSDTCKPYVGRIGELHREAETATSTIVPRYLLSNVVATLRRSHPYEEPAYEVTPLETPNRSVGLGCVGNLPEAVPTSEFLQHIKTVLNVPCLRHSEIATDTVSRIALCGGGGSEFIETAISADADLYLTADLKYHDFQRGTGRITIADGGHFETEVQVIDIFYELISKKIPTFAVCRIARTSNAVNYLSCPALTIK